jgi:hypothetical protein
MSNIPIKIILEDPAHFLCEQNSFGFWDWFCSEKALENRAKSLFSKFKKIAKSPKINPHTMYLWFKNNCPVNGNLYDDFRISYLSTGDVIYTIIPSSGHNTNLHEAELWGKENNFKEAIITGTYSDIIKWFNS